MDLFQILNQMRKYDAEQEEPSSDESAELLYPVVKELRATHPNRTVLAQFSVLHKLNFSDLEEERHSRTSGRFTDSPSTLDRHQQRDINLTDQFTWGSVVCAGIFVVVFVCVMSAWWVQKKRRYNSPERLHNCQQTPEVDNSVRAQRPPSYFEAVSVQDLPPSYSEAIIICRRCNSTIQTGFDNLGANLDDNIFADSAKGNETAATTIKEDGDCIVITVPEHDCCRPSLSSQNSVSASPPCN